MISIYIKAWNALSSQDAIDWSGVEFVANWLGISDLDLLAEHLFAIKAHLNERAKRDAA